MSSLSFGKPFRNLQNWGHGISTVASAVLPFDPTPGFNLNTHTGSGVPFVQREPSTNAGQTSLPKSEGDIPTAPTPTSDGATGTANGFGTKNSYGLY